MSALAHMLEDRGFSTVAIASIRAQAENTRPPRALWTTAQLGRPIGESNDPAHQRQVIMAALSLLERTDGPVILEDFTIDPPGFQDAPGWLPPELPPLRATPEGAEAWSTLFAAELARLLPQWRRAKAQSGRTTVGLSFQEPDAWPSFAARVLAGELPTVPGHATTALAARFLCDDIKALYGEVAQFDVPPPSSRQVDHWFWRQTIAGQLLIALREVAMQSENNALKTVGGRFFVPVPWLPA